MTQLTDHLSTTSDLATSDLATVRNAGIVWSADSVDPTLEVAEVQVPLDYRQPDSEQITLALTRRPARNPERRRGVLTGINGGPGGDNGMGRRFPDELRDQPVAEVYDLVGFDPRGTGISTRLEGEATATEAIFTSRPSDDMFAAIAEDMRRREVGCATVGAGLREHVTTNNTARDLDRLRALLGEEKISFVGWAYGSLVAAVYGEMFPERLDRSVLDSCVHPDWDWQMQFSTQAQAIRDSVDVWAEWVAERHGTFGLGTSSGAVMATVEQIAAQLADCTYNALGRTLFDDLIGSRAPIRSSWAELAEKISYVGAAAATGGADECMQRVGDGRRWRPGEAAGGLREAVLEAVTSETPWPRDLEPYFAAMRIHRETYPYGFGVMRVMPWVGTFNTTPLVESRVSIGPRGYPPGLVVQSEGDPWDHRIGGVAMAERLDDVLIEVVDSGAHEIYAQAGNLPVDALVNDYLVDGVLPSATVQCPGEARPEVPAL
jgi:pimeloyl-ACP methyl ester carboxylesterase